MIKVTTEAALSVGGAYYKEYMFEDGDYNIGDIIKAKLRDIRGNTEQEYDIDLEVTQELLDRINSAREAEKAEAYFQSIRVTPTLYLYGLDNDIVPYNNDCEIYGMLCETVENGDYDIWDENGELDFDKEREVIYKMPIEDVKDIVYACKIFDSDDYMSELYDAKEDEDNPDREYYEKIWESNPDLYLMFTEEELKKLGCEPNRKIEIDGLEYHLIDWW